MKAYGETLRQIREQKGLTMKELADGICSISFLSKFERGDSDMTLGLFTDILEKMMMSFDEFLFVHNEFQSSQLEQFFRAVHNAYTQGDSDALRKLKQQQTKKWQQFGVETYQYHVLMLHMYEGILDNKRMDEEVTKEDIQRLADYFFRIEVWGLYEFMLYNATLFFLEPETVLLLSRTAYEKSIRYKDFQKVNDVITTILMNSITYLLGPVTDFTHDTRFQTELNEFFSYLHKLSLPEHKLFERANLLQLKGAYKLRLGETEQGITKIRKSIYLFRELGAVGQAKRIENYLELILVYQEPGSLSTRQ
ncbi:helix-turn-helix domain-containing protein [Sporosarcina saromensis]|uniref:Helix-turn-helix domain-containing protein n=1 Tax=Sporosarcina saromensis TaxID=359365 RepID=A0ABU4GAY9_9BACL|nr:helix-turn-helix domain-containing protein [Sporosarcina saromensis]MDW0113468.1 helix-turn-helix domain-containing protein [Sporosarcina saromensis]